MALSVFETDLQPKITAMKYCLQKFLVWGQCDLSIRILIIVLIGVCNLFDICFEFLYEFLQRLFVRNTSKQSKFCSFVIEGSHCTHKRKFLRRYFISQKLVSRLALIQLCGSLIVFKKSSSDLIFTILNAKPQRRSNSNHPSPTIHAEYKIRFEWDQGIVIRFIATLQIVRYYRDHDWGNVWSIHSILIHNNDIIEGSLCTHTRKFLEWHFVTTNFRSRLVLTALI